jgi:hypothetical protein
VNDGSQLSVPDAAKFICDSFTKEYRRQCLAFWRQLWGDEYADQVEAEVLRIFKPGKRK